MRRPLMAFALGLIVLEAISVSGHAALAPRIVPMPQSLKAVTLPKPVGINAYVKNEAAAIALGKAAPGSLAARAFEGSAQHVVVTEGLEVFGQSEVHGVAHRNHRPQGNAVTMTGADQFLRDGA